MDESSSPKIQSLTFNAINLGSRDVYDRFNKWRSTKTLTDFMIVSAENKRYPVHMCVVAAWSDYMELLLLNEHFGDSKNSVTLEAVPAKVSILIKSTQLR